MKNIVLLIFSFLLLNWLPAFATEYEQASNPKQVQYHRPHTPEELRQIIENAKREQDEMYKRRNQKLRSQKPSSGKMITRTFTATIESMTETKEEH